MALNGRGMAQRKPLQAKAGSTRLHTLRFPLTPTLTLGAFSLPFTLEEALARGLLALWGLHLAGRRLGMWLDGQVGSAERLLFCRLRNKSGQMTCVSESGYS